MSDKVLHTDPPAEQTPEVPASDWPSPGKKLLKRREELGLSQGRVADALHLTAHYVKALECDQYDKLPGKTFVKGYFRSYAKLLGVDVEEVMTCYEQYVAAQEESSETEISAIQAKKAYDQNLRWMICAAVIIVVVVGVSWWLAHRGETDASMVDSRSEVIAAQPSDPDAEALTAEVLIATLEQATDQTQQDEDTAVNKPISNDNTQLLVQVENTGGNATPAGQDSGLEPEQEIVTTQVSATGGGEDIAGGQETGPPEYSVIEANNRRQVQLESGGEDLLEVHFSGASWIEVDNGNNTRLYHDMLDTGDDLTIRGKAPFNILIGDANVVDMTFNSRAVDIGSRMRTDNSARIILAPETH